MTTDDGTVTPWGALSVRLPARPGQLAGLRHRVSAWLAGMPGASPVFRSDTLLAISELFTNAIEAGATEVATTVWRSGSVVRVVVTDDGPDWSPSARPPAIPDPTSLRGRGLALTSRLGTLAIDRAHERTRVTLTLELT